MDRKFERIEVDVDNLKDPEAKKYVNDIMAIMKQSQERKTPIICLTIEPSNNVALLGLQGARRDFSMLIKEALKKVPGFTEAVAIASILCEKELREEVSITEAALKSQPQGN